MLNAFFESKRSTKRAISFTYDLLAISLSLFLAICLRLGTFKIPVTSSELTTLAITIVVPLAIFLYLGLYKVILRYMDLSTLTTILIGISVSSAILAASSFFMQSSIPRSVPFIYLFTAFFFIGAPRLLIKSILFSMHNAKQSSFENVIIYGAGYTGHQLALSLQKTPYNVVAFVDDNPKLNGKTLFGKTIYRPKNLEQLTSRLSATKVLLALGNTPRATRAKVIEKLEQLSVHIQTIPAYQDILAGNARIEDIKDVQIEDLLGRNAIVSQPELLHACITGKVVMVTGAGGSIGSELCRQIIRQQPCRLVLFELNEYSLYQIEQELRHELTANQADTELIPLLGSVQKEHRLETIMSTFKVQTVYHAAAYKHVPLVEHNIVEGVRNNVFGTWYCAEAAIKTGVESFVLISTDKAVRPTNIMGTSKRVAELVLQGLAQRQSTTRFTMVRFGNVLGSSGSVVPLFRKQIKRGGPITVTHPDIIRYFMTIPEAAELVIQAGSMGQGGDVFVLDMGEPVKILDLAKRMIHLSGLDVRNDDNPGGDIEIQFTGLRPGEKLYEELLIGDNVSGTAHSRIMRATEKALSWPETHSLLINLNTACHHYLCNDVKQLLLNAPTDYHAGAEIEDWVWSHKHESPKLD